MGPRGILAALCATAVVGLAMPARADVVVEHMIRSDGLAGLGAFEGASQTQVSPLAKWEQTTFRFSGGFLGAIQRAAGLGDEIRITRLDRDLVWTLDPEKKTYTESLLTARAERERRVPGSPPPRREPRGESDVVVTKNEFKVDRTGATKTINGFPCEQYVATWTVETRNQKTGETGRSLMSMDVWSTPETAAIRAAQAEEQAYARAYLEKLKLELAPEEARRLGLAAMAAATGLGEAEQQKALGQVAAELGKIHGYWVVTDVKWRAEAGGGEGREGQPASGGTGQPSDLAALFGKLLSSGQARSGAGDAGGGAAGGARPLFGFYSEVRSLKVVPTDPARFEIPPGYTRKSP